MCAMEGNGRAARVLLAVLVAILGSVAGRSASAATAASTVTLTLAPAQGVVTSAFTMTFRDVDPLGLICPGGTVTFSWDAPSRTLATAPLGGPNCTATASSQAPTGSAPGAHAVTARAAPLMATATYQVMAAASATPRPTPTRTPTRRPSPTPTPTPPPTPEPTPVVTPPPPPCDTRVPQATGATGYLVVAGVAGDVTEPQHAGAILVRGVLPASMLPPALGTVPLTEVDLLRTADRSSSALLRAVSTGTHFDCVQLELGPGQQYLYATYAFHDALFSTYTPTDAGERLTLSYISMEWEYQLRDGSPVAAGRGNLGDTPHPRPMRPVGMALGPVMAVMGLLVVAGGTGGGVLGFRWWLRRRRRQLD